MGKYDKLKGLVPTYKEALSDLKKEYSEKTEDELLEEFSKTKEQKKDLEKTLKDVDRKLTAIEETLVEVFEARNITNVTSSKFGVFAVRTKVYVHQKDKEALHTWLKENKYEDLIKPQVNAQVLNALFTDILSNSSLPEHAGVQVFLKSSISNTK